MVRIKPKLKEGAKERLITQREALHMKPRRKTLYRVPVRFVIEGYFLIEAESAKSAYQTVKDGCGMISPAIQAPMTEDVKDWNFPMHPNKIISKVTKA